MFSGEIRNVEKNSNTLHWDNRKDGLRTSQDLTRPYPPEVQECKCVNSFKRFSLMLGLVVQAFNPST
jgi:hypothetical protein